MMPFTVTFYSYKGGVGRTILAANVAAWLARWGKTVLWDLDLEAPGLHRIPDLKSPKPNVSGFFEWLKEWQVAHPDFGEPTDEECGKLGRCLLPVERQPNLLVLPAHGDEAPFARLYQEVEWNRFLAEAPAKGIALFRRLIAHLAEKEGVRYLVLDSRTGITDMGGLLAAVLPHVTVLVGNYGPQNTGGLVAIRKALQPQIEGKDPDRGELPALRIELVASPIPQYDAEDAVKLKEEWGRYFGLAADRLLEIPESARLRQREQVLALAEDSNSELGQRYVQLTQRVLQIEAEQQRERLSAEQAESERRAELERGITGAPSVRIRVTTYDGKDYRETTASLLRMLGYQVELSPSSDFDYSASLRQGLEESNWLVSCKGGEISGQTMLGYMHPMLGAGPFGQQSARIMLVAHRFTAEALSLAKSSGIRCFTHDDLEKALVDFRPYLNRLVSDFTNSALATCYVDQFVRREKSAGETEPLLPHALQWAAGEGNRLWVLLGDYGTGKTAFTRRLAFDLAKAALEQPDAPVPLLVNLRDFPNKASLADVLHEHWAERTGERRDPAIFLHLLGRGKVLLLLDSFDEMGIAQAHRGVVEQFRGLVLPAGGASPAKNANRILVTCREQFFRDRNEARKAAKEGAEASPLEQAARDFSGTIDELPRFTEGQIEAYLGKRLGQTQGAEAWQTIQGIYDLKSLADRPQLIEIIIASLPRLSAAGRAVSAGALYLEYINTWLDAPHIRPRERQTSSEELHRLLEALAQELWASLGQQIHYRDLFSLVSELRGQRDPVNLDVELRTAAFLSRSPDGFYRFSHRSFLEFFLARAILRGAKEGRLAEVLAIPRLSPEVCGFVHNLTEAKEDADAVAVGTKGILEREYQKQASENALTLGYSLYFITVPAADRHKAILDKELAEKHRNGQCLWIPQKAKLAGADLAGISAYLLNLPEADLRGADLQHTFLTMANLRHSQLDGACLDDADLTAANLARTSLRSASLLRAGARGAWLTDADCTAANAAGIVLFDARARGSIWKESCLRDARMARSDFSGASLEGAEIGRISAPHARLPDVWSNLADVSIAPLRPYLPGHTGGVNACAFSPDGALVLTGSDDATARLWDGASGRELLVLVGHSSDVTCCAFSPDGAWLLTGSSDSTARLWGATSGKELLRIEGHGEGITSCAFSPDGARLLTASLDDTARLWDTASGKELLRLEEHGNWVTSCAFSPDGARLLTASWDDTAHLWDAASGKELLRLEGHGAAVESCAFSPDGARLLTASWDESARVWDATSGKELLCLVGHGNSVMSCAFSPDGARLLTASADKTARLWDAASGKELLRLEGHGNVVTSCAFSPDDNRLLTSSGDNTARLWDVVSGKELIRLVGHGNVAMSCAFSPDGARLLTASDDNTARLWDTATGKEQLRLEGHGREVTSCAFSPDGALLLTASTDGTARLWDAASGNEQLRLEGHGREVTSCTFSPDGARLLTGSWDKTARLWDAASGKELLRLEGHGAGVTSCAFSPDGAWLLTGSSDAIARLWDADSGRELVRLEGHVLSVTSCAFSPDGTRLFTGSWDDPARLWDAATGKELLRLEGHGAEVTSCAFSPDGARLLIGSEDATARLWDTATGKELLRLEGHGSAVTSCAFSPDGARLLTASGDRTTRLWDAATGKELMRYISAPDGWLSLDMRTFKWRGVGSLTENVFYVDPSLPPLEAPRHCAADLPELRADD